MQIVPFLADKYEQNILSSIYYFSATSNPAASAVCRKCVHNAGLCIMMYVAVLLSHRIMYIVSTYPVKASSVSVDEDSFHCRTKVIERQNLLKF